MTQILAYTQKYQLWKEQTLNFWSETHSVLIYNTIQYYIFYLNTVKVKAYAAYGAVLQC